MTETDFALVGDAAGNAERLQADADALGGFRGGLYAFLKRDRAADGVRPNRVLERYYLYALDDFFDVDFLDRKSVV